MACLAALRSPVWSIPTIFLISVMIWLASSRFSDSLGDIVWDLISIKQQSAQEHVVPLSEWIANFSDWAILGGSDFNYFESWWARAVINFGMIWTFISLAMVFALILSAWRAQQHSPRGARPIYTGLLFFSVYFSIGSLNLPFLSIFPANVIFFMFSFPRFVR